jgi:hypothetical protein
MFLQPWEPVFLRDFWRFQRLRTVKRRQAFLGGETRGSAHSTS